MADSSASNTHGPADIAPLARAGSGSGANSSSGADADSSGTDARAGSGSDADTGDQSTRWSCLVGVAGGFSSSTLACTGDRSSKTGETRSEMGMELS